MPAAISSLLGSTVWCTAGPYTLTRKGKTECSIVRQSFDDTHPTYPPTPDAVGPFLSGQREGVWATLPHLVVVKAFLHVIYIRSAFTILREIICFFRLNSNSRKVSGMCMFLLRCSPNVSIQIFYLHAACCLPSVAKRHTAVFLLTSFIGTRPHSPSPWLLEERERNILKVAFHVNN